MNINAGEAFRCNLATTLPPGVRGGGTFAVDPNGAQLPAGVTLTESGDLLVPAETAQGQTTGIVFSYTEP